jgi:hypothetical protein
VVQTLGDLGNRRESGLMNYDNTIGLDDVDNIEFPCGFAFKQLDE